MRNAARVIGRTLHQKIVDDHAVARTSDGEVLLFVDLHVMNEYTSPQAFTGLKERGLPVLMPTQQMAVVDHIIPTSPEEVRVIRDPAAARQAANLKRNCAEHGLQLIDANSSLQGIEHVVAPELGLIQPGMVVLVGDSHATTYGAFGALGFGIGTSEVEHVLATQTLLYKPADDMRIVIDGDLPIGCTSKDLVLHLIRRLGARGGRGFVIEFDGTTVSALSVEARMTLCNMAVEAGARGALIAPDDRVTRYVVEKAATGLGRQDDAIQEWRTLRSDPDACFAVDMHIDAGEVAPQVTWGTSPDQTVGIDETVPDPRTIADPGIRQNVERALSYMDVPPGRPLVGLPVDRVFIGSCTNGRIEDLRIVAELVKGRSVHPGVRAMVVPGSGLVRRQAELEGIADVLIASGFEWRKPGCSMCLAMNDDVLRPGERCVSTTNRNFEGRQGRGGRTHLVSPAMAAAAALTGHITDVRNLGASR